jgi:hypothetical protein
MYLILRQLVCANLPGVGYKTFAGDRISLDVQQAFTELYQSEMKLSKIEGE